MARITSKNLLKEYILRQLGAPTVEVEVDDEQMDDVINNAVQRFTEFAYGTLEEVVLLDIDGTGEYALPDAITNILAVSKGGAVNLTNFGANFGGMVPNIWSDQFFTGSLTGGIVQSIMTVSATRSLLDKYFTDQLSYHFNPHKKTLKVQENYKGRIIVHYQYEYIANDANDFIFDHQWIKAYTVAKCKLLQSDILGKYDQTLIGGARINHEKMQSRAEQEIDKLEEDLLSKWSDPAPILIG
jgi:hypothetical protein